MKKYRLLQGYGYPETLEVGKVYPADHLMKSGVAHTRVDQLAKFYPEDWALVSPYEEKVEEIEKRLDALDKKFEEILNRLKV